MTSQQEYDKLCEYECSINSADVQADNISDVEYLEYPANDIGKQSVKKKTKGSKNVANVDPSARQVRCFKLISYIPLPYLAAFIENQPWIHHWAYAVHDKDLYTPKDAEKNSDNVAGTPKKVHIHVLLYTHNQKSSRAVSKIFDRYAKSICAAGEQFDKTLCQPNDDKVRWWRYLIHADEVIDEYTHRYPDSSRVCDDWNYWSRLEQSQGMNDSEKNVAHSMVMDYIGGVPHLDMLERYGYKFLQQRKSIVDMAARICIEKGWPIRDVVGRGDKMSLENLELLLSTSKFTETEQKTFYLVWSYIQNQCLCSYGSALDIYLQERN